MADCKHGPLTDVAVEMINVVAFRTGLFDRVSIFCTLLAYNVQGCDGLCGLAGP